MQSVTMKFISSIAVVLLVTFAHVTCVRYKPNWESIDSRPLPTWYDEGKLGIFLHWGVFSVPSFGSEWFWYWWKKPNPNPDFVEFMKKNYPPDFTYADFAPMFKAEFYDPNQWADIFKAAGAKYVVLTSKHHEGFTLWPSKVSWNWNAMDVGPKRDLLGDLANAIRKRTDIHFGVYHSLFEWFNPLFLQDQANNFTTQDFVARKALPELYELVNTYKPEVIWSDGDWLAPDVYWNATHFLAWLYNDSPVKDTVCVNDRWGSNNIRCHHGGFLNCDDRFNPDTMPKRKWEDAMTVDRGSWGYRRNANIGDLLTVADLVSLLAKTVSLGGNLLVNVGPTADGMIAPEYEERLRGMGQWLDRNGEAIYSTHPWIHQNDTLTPDIWYTSRNYSIGEVVYAISLKWYGGSTLVLGGAQPGDQTTVTLLGSYQFLPYTYSEQGGMEILVPNLPPDQISTPGHAWVFRLDYLKNRRK